MSRFAENTKVSAQRTRDEIERVLANYGASAFGFLTEGNTTMIAFRVRERNVRITIQMPRVDSTEFSETPAGQQRSEGQAFELWKRACRQRWRALLLVMRSKLESVESGIETFDEAFLPHLVLPNGSCVRELAIPAIEEAYSTGQVPRSLLGLPEPEDKVVEVGLTVEEGAT